jgi:hypothetical protein
LPDDALMIVARGEKKDEGGLAAWSSCPRRPRRLLFIDVVSCLTTHDDRVLAWNEKLRDRPIEIRKWTEFSEATLIAAWVFHPIPMQMITAHAKELMKSQKALDSLPPWPDVCPSDCGIAIAPPPPLLCDGLTSPRCVGDLLLSGRRRAIRKGTNHDPCNRKIA